jgi:hypothetical protein
LNHCLSSLQAAWTSPDRKTRRLKGQVIVVGGAAMPAWAQGMTQRVSVSSAGGQGNGSSGGPAISPNGRFVAFYSDASNLVAGDTNQTSDAFIRDRQKSATERVSVSSGGVQGNGNSYSQALSVDGRIVGFYSDASNLVAGDTNNVQDVFVRDRRTGTTERVSINSAGEQGNNTSIRPAFSADGRFVAFYSSATNLVSGGTNGAFHVFVRDRGTGTTEQVSVNPAGEQATLGGLDPVLSADGRFVAFFSPATNLVPDDTNGFAFDVFIRDRLTSTTEQVSVNSVGSQGNDASSRPAISADGRFVTFDSAATNLVAGDINNTNDVFVRDRQIGTTQRVRVSSGGGQGNGSSLLPALSPDGRFVAYQSDASNLVPGDTGAFDSFVYDRRTGTTERVSVSSTGEQGSGNSYSFNTALSSKGRFATFESDASNLVLGDTNGMRDVFVRILAL